jgi:hypothetical protein
MGILLDAKEALASPRNGGREDGGDAHDRVADDEPGSTTSTTQLPSS